MPVILVGREFWSGLVAWMNERMAGAGLINPGDTSLMQIEDDPDAVVETIFRFYESRGLILPERRGSNRTYSRRDRARLRLILRGKNLGFSLEDIGDYLSLYDSDPAQITQTRLLLERVEGHIADLNAKRADLDRTLDDLKEIRAQCKRHLSAHK